MRVAIALLAVLCITASVCASEAQVVYAFQSRGREYQVAFTEAPKPPNSPWYEDMIMRWRLPGGNQWHTVAKVPGVRLERLVRIEHHGVHGAVVASRPGGSAQFISVIEISKHPPGLRTLLRDELDKGGFDYRFDPHGMLTGFRFHYHAWHVGPDIGSEMGHVLTKRDITWSANKHRFFRSLVRIDDEAERKADLADLLLAIGAEEFLGVKTMHTADGSTIAIYRPVGILGEKTPKALRSARWVKAVITRPPDGQPTKVIDMQPWTPPKTAE